MNPPSPTGPSLTPNVPRTIDDGELLFTLDGVGEPTSLEVVAITGGTPEEPFYGTAELVNKLVGAELFDGGATLTTAITPIGESVWKFGITRDHMPATTPIVRVIVVTADGTFTFE